MKRRNFLGLSAGLLGPIHLAAGQPAGTTHSRKRIDSWNLTHDRIFLGGDFWANPMEDWRVEDGWAVCQTASANRNIQSLIYRLAEPEKPFGMAVELGRKGPPADDGGAGFRIGIRSELNDHRADCFARNGINAGLAGDQLVLGGTTAKLESAPKGDVFLVLESKPAGRNVTLTLTARDSASRTTLGSVSHSFPGDRVRGNIALVSAYPKDKDQSAHRSGPHGPAGYRFRNWVLDGNAFSKHEDHRFGPILWSMYSLSDSRTKDGFVLKLTALTGPMGEKDSPEVELEIERGGAWRKIATAKLDTDAWTATFRVPNWNEKSSTPFRLTYREKRSDGTEAPSHWTGSIRANPTKPLRIGSLTCQEDGGFPYKPIADNLVKLDLDLLFFSGDQVYEQNGGFGIIRNPAIPASLNFLRKFYMFGWAFREPMRNAPTICLPDDHDVFHGNIWGEGGAPYNRSVRGLSASGYMQPARMVNVVHKANCSHHPDLADPRPCKQDISVYYGSMLYGGVGFAILADRQWKSGPERSGNTGARVDHVLDPNFNIADLDKPGLQLLGERQEEFLGKWASDWDGHTMKAVLSQTVLSGVGTHHHLDGYIRADLDSGGWPQTARNRAIDLMRPSMALHICGDQHLASLSQYGVKKQRDSNWAFCTPAITVGYQRWWLPDEVDMPHTNRPSHNFANSGEYLDCLGNKIYMYNASNPPRDSRLGRGTRYDRAHRMGSGFGVITIDSSAKTYTLECYRFLCDVADGKAENQFPGYPVTLHQKENRGENVIEA